MEQTKTKAVRTPKEAVKEYQCLGCMDGSYPDCYKTEAGYSISCRKHFAGTIIGGQGKIFLGMPKAFNRLGHYEKMRVNVYEDYNEDVVFDKFNVPVWKHLDEYGNTLVRGLRPRLNEPFIDVILGNHLDKIDCIEISREELLAMD